MGTGILKNGDIVNMDLDDLNNNDVIAYFYNSNTDATVNVEERISIHNDIVIKNNEGIIIKVPYVENRCKKSFNIILDDKKCISNYNDERLIEFIEEKISIFKKIDNYTICLLFFEYFSFIYTEELLQLESEIDELFEGSVDKGIIDNKEILFIKKDVSLIKRYVIYYKSVLSYLDDEFKQYKILAKVLLVIENTLNLVENVEASIYSCIDIYNSVLSNRMNKTMQLLTVITVMAIPLTIVTGIFGMNFEVMPLLQNTQGFYISMGGVGLIVLAILIYFKNKKFF
ncbi:MAG: CorA family divalent cation transporter [Clostridium sp.]